MKQVLGVLFKIKHSYNRVMCLYLVEIKNIVQREVIFLFEFVSSMIVCSTWMSLIPVLQLTLRRQDSQCIKQW